MTAVKENLLTMIPDMPSIISNLTEDRANQVYDIFLTVKPNEIAHKEVAEKRLELIESRRYVRPRGRTHEEIETDLKEMRSDRF